MLVADLLMGLPQETGSSPMEIDFSMRMLIAQSIDAEVRWWYKCIVEEVEWKGSTVVRYLNQ